MRIVVLSYRNVLNERCWSRSHPLSFNLVFVHTGSLVTGSLQGVLRIFQPRGRESSAEDLLLETQLSAPILQLELGSFTSYAPVPLLQLYNRACISTSSLTTLLRCRLGGSQLAVLHPRALIIYSLNTLASSQGVAGLQLSKVSEQSLERSAANMVCGNFGGSSGALSCIYL